MAGFTDTFGEEGLDDRHKSDVVWSKSLRGLFKAMTPVSLELPRDQAAYEILTRNDNARDDRYLGADRA